MNSLMVSMSLKTHTAWSELGLTTDSNNSATKQTFSTFWFVAGYTGFHSLRLAACLVIWSGLINASDNQYKFRDCGIDTTFRALWTEEITEEKKDTLCSTFVVLVTCRSNSFLLWKCYRNIFMCEQCSCLRHLQASSVGRFLFISPPNMNSRCSCDTAHYCLDDDHARHMWSCRALGATF